MKPVDFINAKTIFQSLRYKLDATQFCNLNQNALVLVTSTKFEAVCLCISTTHSECMCNILSQVWAMSLLLEFPKRSKPTLAAAPVGKLVMKTNEIAPKTN